MKQKYFWLFLAVVWVGSEGKESANDGGASVFTSLLETMTSSNISPSCSGRCFNALAALACREVVDKPGLCNEPGYRCCINISTKDEKPDKPAQTDVKSPAEQSNLEKLVTSLDKQATNANLGGKVVNLEIQVNDDGQDLNSGKQDEASEKSDSDAELLQYSPSASVKVCPGVCVAERISNFCEAAIDVQGLCKPQLRCCVPANLFEGVDKVPSEFVILNPADGAESGDESRSEMTDAPKATTDSTTTSTTKTTKTTQRTSPKSTTSRTTPKRTTTERTTTSKTKDSKSPEGGAAEAQSANDGIPPEKRCKGTCVAGFFAFLCDAIDKSGECPREGRCCVTTKRPKPDRPSDKEGGNDNKSKRPNRNTTPRPKRKRPTTTTTQETPTTERDENPPCRGTCLPVSVASRCQSPSRLVVASGCREDEICCDDRGKKKPSAKDPPPKRPESSMPSLGSLLSLFGGGLGTKADKPPPRRTSPPRPTTTTTSTTTLPPTTTEAIVIPDCPGTCISPILSFTCFGNAEMTSLFKCNKDKQSCCAPKSAIRELNRQNEMKNIARNDTVFTPPFNPYAPYGQPPFNAPTYDHSQYPPNPYEHPNFIHQNYHQQPSEETNYPSPYYNHGSLQPPPPPQLQGPHHQQPTFEHPPPPSFQEPTFETPPSDHAYPPYRQAAGSEQSGTVQQPPYQYAPENSAPYYQHGPTYEQNQSVRYTYPTEVPTTTIPAVTTLAAVTSEVSNKYVCGIKGTNRAARVVGGEDSVPGEWCWQVALINSLNQYLCGGALIGTQWVLTAAHCVTNIVRSGDAIYVRVGDHDLTTRFGSPGAQTIPVATTYIHHNHNSQTLDNDIALLKLSSHAELGNGVCLVCLPARGVSQVAGKRCTVTGYGYMGETGPIPLRVREAEIPVVSDNECVRKINAVTEKIFILPASSFCAGGESGHDACQGDGGGPLVCNVDNYFELSGLVSWGFGCGRQDVPGVYVKVSSFIGWVNQIISVNNT